MVSCKRGIFAAAFYVLMQMAWAGAACADVIWLSEVPPFKRTAALKVDEAQHEHHHDAVAANSMSAQSAVVSASSAVAAAGAKKHDHGSGTEVDASGEIVDNTHSGAKRVWLRRGNDPFGSIYTGTGRDSETLTLLGHEGALPDAVMKLENGTLSAKLDLPELGFYNVYLTQSMVHGDMLHVQVAKAELLHGTCCAKGVDEEAVAKPIINANMPLELVREHYPDEGLFTRIVSGDKVNFIVLSYGMLVAGATVSMTTQNGWSNRKVSDADGRVSFTMIRDYYTAWLEFKKYHKQTFLMTADLEVADKIVSHGASYNSAHYTSTLAGSYYPSPHDYRSYAWGLGIGMFVIVFGGASIYLYRRRRLKPYQEVRVDDKA